MRSDSFLEPVKYSVKNSFLNKEQVDTVATKKSQSGKKGIDIIKNYKNNSVISSWDYIDISSNVRWSIISEINISEALNPINKSGVEFYKNYIEEYGYYDLFLIDKKGHIFYTVTKEADFNNINYVMPMQFAQVM
jgi:methyl-accepting chemotaxis protein